MSARRLRPVLTRDARTDLSDILVYTEQQWGRQQRIAYRALIQNAIRELARFPLLGHTRDELSPGLRSQPVGSHVIYYWVDDEALNVAHILHSRRDIEGEIWAKPDLP